MPGAAPSSSQTVDGASSSASANAASSAPPNPQQILGPGQRTVTDQIQDGEVARWAATLQVARVSRWGGMISTPDASLQVSRAAATNEPKRYLTTLISP